MKVTHDDNLHLNDVNRSRISANCHRLLNLFGIGGSSEFGGTFVGIQVPNVFDKVATAEEVKSETERKR